MSLEIHTIPVISTAHITQEVNDRLVANDNPWCVHANYEGCGYYLFLDELYSGNEEVPQCLTDICDWRRGLEKAGILDNSCWVRLDCDADTVDDLPTYNW